MFPSSQKQDSGLNTFKYVCFMTVKLCMSYFSYRLLFTSAAKFSSNYVVTKISVQTHLKISNWIMEKAYKLFLYLHRILL